MHIRGHLWGRKHQTFTTEIRLAAKTKGHLAEDPVDLLKPVFSANCRGEREQVPVMGKACMEWLHL